MTSHDNKQAELEISLIKKIMDDSRQAVEYNGIHFIFWGTLVAICLIINYFFVISGTAGKYAGILWSVAMPIGAITDAFIGWRMQKKQPASTFAGRMLGSLWLASGIAMFIFGFLGPAAGAYKHVFICPVISTLLGATYFTSGSLQQLPWLRNLSLAWWGGAALMYLWPGKQTLLVFALMMILLQVLPGMMLYRKVRSSIQVSRA